MKKPRKSVDWQGFSFTWYAHKKAFRVIELDPEASLGGRFVGWYGPTLADAKREAVASCMRELSSTFQDSELDATLECLEQRLAELHRKAIRVRQLCAALREGDES